MNSSRDPDRLIHAFLLEGAERLQDQVYDAVRSEIEQQRQRVVIGPWRVPILHRLVPIGLAAAAVLAVLVVGSRLPGPPSSIVGGPGVEPTSTAGASAAPTPTPGDLLPDRSHVLWDGSVRTTVTVPAHWYGKPGDGILENSGGEDFGPEHAGIITGFVDQFYVPADPCRWVTTLPDSPATTVDEVVAALQGQASRDASEPVDITVDGHAGKAITLHVPEDADFAECEPSPVGPEGRFCMLAAAEAADCQRHHQFPSQIDELWIVDVNGEVMVIDASWSDATPAEAKAEMRAILESMTFEAP